MERTAINEFRKQKPDVILQMSLSFNQFGFGSLELTFKVDCCDHIEETLKAIAGPHKVDPEAVVECYNKAMEEGRWYLYDSNEVLVDVCFYTRDFKGNICQLKKGKTYA